MKTLFILFLLFAATNMYGQTINGKIPGVRLDTLKNPAIGRSGLALGNNNDTALRVIYTDQKKPGRQPAYFINGKLLMGEFLMNSLNPKRIENINIIKRDTLINNIQYYGQVHIKTKSDYTYNPKIISLTELKNKYTNLKGKPVIFRIDGNTIHADYDNFVIDENNVLTIIIDKFQNEKESLDLGLIEVLTKTEKNITNRKIIYIRGTEVTMNK